MTAQRMRSQPLKMRRVMSPWSTTSFTRMRTTGGTWNHSTSQSAAATGHSSERPSTSRLRHTSVGESTTARQSPSATNCTACPKADNQAKVRIRFAMNGTWSWYWAVDNFGLYSIEEAPTTVPAIDGICCRTAVSSQSVGRERQVSACKKPPIWPTRTGRTCQIPGENRPPRRLLTSRNRTIV